MDIDVAAQIIIKTPRSRVAPYTMDPNNDKSWIGHLDKVDIISDGPLSEGSHVQRIATLMDQRIEYIMEIDELEPLHLLEMHSIEGPFPLKVTYRFDEEHSDTIVHIRVRANPRGMYSLASPIISRALEENIRQDLETLKQIFEYVPEDS
jgi:uncharacterized membrane protein